MKKLYSLLCVVFSGSMLLAQGYTISPSDSVHQNIQVGGYFTSTINLPHDGLNNDTVVIGWEMLSVELPAGSNWDYSYCDYTACHAGNITSATMTQMYSGQSAFFKVNVSADVAGFAMFKVKVFNIDNPQNFDILTYTFNATLGLEEQTEQAVNIFPNPVTDDRVTITHVRPGTQITITNALGQTVFSREVAVDKENLVLQNLGLYRGVYFVRMSSQGKVYASRKLIVR